MSVVSNDPDLKEMLAQVDTLMREYRSIQAGRQHAYEREENEKQRRRLWRKIRARRAELRQPSTARP